MAYFKKRGNSWQAQVSWYDTDNTRKYKTKSGFATKTQAKKWANEFEVAKDKNQITNYDPIFIEYFLDWAKTYRIPGKTTTSVDRYYQIYKHLKEYFKNQKLSKISRSQYQKFINEYGSKHAKITVQKNHSTISACVNDAIADKIITTNFTKRINLIWDKDKTRTVDYLTNKEVVALLANLENKINPRFTSRYMIITALYTGMRIGEIMALEWTDINFKRNTISITKTYDYINNKLKEPKTPSSVRTIRVNDSLLNLLQQLNTNNPKFVFADKNGKLPSPAGINKVLRIHLKECNINRSGFHFHSLRHTHVAMLLFKGIDLYAISKRLGHSNMTITAKAYAYMLEEYKAQQNDKIENILNEI
ncbi:MULTISPECIES: tyrosine-type recombinase/integrase [unclassified Lactobacillus]|uniref:site-specific integrase n=1 Tax=unclassified Lactobacillus TaxID=2620435 RepID=UPI000EFC3D25|nr:MULTISPECIES: tyrosine-type recombinase/integrase [unclassified Lactobacillus]RMC24469.1 site-specific integrase [Lactobacillus sp. ESL0247]RMC28608.1 site-specific integrase [Lactobacillus sp. ESL0246]RMC31800.1 site-specific integrase [Lactobacillus sp. ESL0245]